MRRSNLLFSCLVGGLLIAVLPVTAVTFSRPAPARPAADRPVHTWNQARDGRQTRYRFKELALTLSAGRDDSNSGPRLDLLAKNGAKLTIFGVDSFKSLSATFDVLHLNPKYSAVDVVFATYSGGTHCCTNVKVLSLLHRSWKVVELGDWDGDPATLAANQPRDLTGNGDLEFVFADNRFLYTFGPYADSEMPPKILRIEDGVVLDVSAQQQCRKLYRRDMLVHQPGYAKGINGACAAFVASAIRAGLYHWAWTFMLKHYNHKDQWGLSMQNTEYGAGCMLPLKFSDFPKALQWFLRDTGYLNKGR